MAEKQPPKICPVCGYSGLEEAPYDEYGYPTHIICHCCGFEFGFDDSSEGYTFVAYRKKWISNGFKFFTEEFEPQDWNKDKMKKQLENVKLVNYTPRL